MDRPSWWLCSAVDIDEVIATSHATIEIDPHQIEEDLDGQTGEAAMRQVLAGSLDYSQELNLLRRRHEVISYRISDGAPEDPENLLYQLKYLDRGPLKR